MLMISRVFKGRFSSSPTFNWTTGHQLLSVEREEIFEIDFAQEGGDDLFQIAG